MSTFLSTYIFIHLKLYQLLLKITNHSAFMFLKRTKINMNPLRRSPLRSPGGGMASPVSSYHQSPVSPRLHSPIPPYAHSPFIRPTLSASEPAKSVPNSPAHLTGSPHYSPSSNKVLLKCIQKLCLLLHIAYNACFFPVADKSILLAGFKKIIWEAEKAWWFIVSVTCGLLVLGFVYKKGHKTK